MKKIIFIVFGILSLIVFGIFVFQSFSARTVEQNHSETATHPEVAATMPVEVNPSGKQFSPVYSIDIPEQVNFAGEEAPLEVFYVREYLDRELTVNTYFHSSTISLFKRANRWFPLIEPILKENNIPNDFKYLALIESGLENVTSPAGAKGFWQFLKKTGREYGLEVNSGIDERYNVEKSTVAACKYLNESYEKYGNWTLVAAAYNAGNRRISESLEEQRVNSYYDLLLNAETARYVFRILAIKTIFENPGKFGFHIQEEDLYPPIPTKKIKVTSTIHNLVEFAEQHGITYKTLKIFNPWIRKDYLPNRLGRTYYISIPVDGKINYPGMISNKTKEQPAS